MLLALRGLRSLAFSQYRRLQTRTNQDILISALLAKFGARKQPEQAVVQQLADLGSDAVLVSQLADLKQETGMRDANPQATYNVTPAYYFNVWNV